MPHRSVTIFERGRNVVATAEVEFSGGRFSGPANVEQMPQSLRLVFEEYEDIVNDQIFSLLDQIEGRIGAIPFVAVFGDGREAPVEDLQLFPNEGTVAFRLAEPAELHRG